MTTWTYRVMNHRAPGYLGGDEWLEIREVYYKEDGTIDGWTADACWPAGDTREELISDLSRMLLALAEPVLNEWELPGYEDEDNRRSQGVSRLLRKTTILEHKEDEGP